MKSKKKKGADKGKRMSYVVTESGIVQNEDSGEEDEEKRKARSRTDSIWNKSLVSSVLDRNPESNVAKKQVWMKIYKYNRNVFRLMEVRQKLLKRRERAKEESRLLGSLYVKKSFNFFYLFFWCRKL